MKCTEVCFNRLFILFGAIISCYIGLVNKFPVIYEDSGTYISSGFSGIVPADRPIFYGLFIRHFSLSSSLWYVVYAQALMMSYLIFITVGIYFKHQARRVVFISLTALIALFTGYSYYVSFLVPDIFTAAFYLGLYNLLFNPYLKRLEYYFLLLIILFSISAQFSICVLFISFSLFTLIILLMNGKDKQLNEIVSIKKISVFFLIIFSSYMCAAIVNYYSKKNSSESKPSYVFAMNHLWETGVLKDYLDEQCEQKNYRICAYKDSIPWDFMWDNKSPLYKLGGWRANSQEYKTIIWDICLTPKYAVILAQRAFEHTLEQCFTFSSEPSAPAIVVGLSEQMNLHYKEQKRDLLGSEQNQQKLDNFLFNTIQLVLIVFSFVLILVLLSGEKVKLVISHLNLKIGLLLFFFVGNAFVSSTFSTVVHRFQGRIAWLVPFFALLYLLKYLQNGQVFAKIKLFIDGKR